MTNSAVSRLCWFICSISCPSNTSAYPAPAIGSIRLRSLFRTLPTRALTGQHVVSCVGGAQTLRSASLSAVRPSALCLRLHLGHVTALLGLAILPVTRAVIHLAGGIDPDLTGAVTGSRCGGLARISRAEG
jgi:hypothetical protein